MSFVKTYNLTLSGAKARLKDQWGVSTLLSAPESNPKIIKNKKKGVLSSPLHLAPADISGYEVCPMASQGCRDACLHTAGSPLYMQDKERARVARTRLYFNDRNLFMSCLIVETKALVRKAQRQGMQPAIRLNATSDIPFERVKIDHNGVQYPNIMAMFPDVQFYDYTKRPNRTTPDNYHLTFSMAENNDSQARIAIENGMNVAVVFDTLRGHPLPKFYDMDDIRVMVIDGDETDFRPSDPTRVIVGLRAKGDAIGDTSGFVRASYL